MHTYTSIAMLNTQQSSMYTNICGSIYRHTKGL